MRLKLYTTIYITILFTLFFIPEGRAYTGIFTIDDTCSYKNDIGVDFIVNYAIAQAPRYEKIVLDYRAKLYIKGDLDIRKKNFTFRYIPKMVRLQKGVSKYLMESFSELHYTAPNIYDQKVLATYGTTYGKGFQANMLEYFHVNIYSSTLLYNKLLSPLAKNARSYYRYELDSIISDSTQLNYKIRFIPKAKSDQLVGGWMVISSKSWSVREIRFSGRTGLITFENLIKMGRTGDENEFLPVEYSLNAVFKFLGNIIDGSYFASLMYTDIELNENAFKVKHKKKYDLSESYSLTSDNSLIRNDSVYFDSIRPIQLKSEDRLLYQDYNYRRDTTILRKPRHSKALWGAVGEFLLSDININLASVGNVKCSPIINPLLLSYSRSNGFSWRQDFRYNRLFEDGKLLRIIPRIGYNFTRKEFYWSLTSDYDYWPERQATIHLSIGNGNRIYSSDVLDELKAFPDSLFDFNLIHLDYFHDLFFNLKHSIEVTNGLKIGVGVSVHRRTPVKKSKFVILDPSLEIPPDYLNKIRTNYISFAPSVRVEWTPGLYYYMNGRRKMNLYSYFPTFAVDYERGIRGVFNSTGEYERIEFDLQHRINLHLMRNLFYRVGFGFFTNQDEMYFVDFANFSRSSLPTGWNDDIGGMFQLLDGRWYNSSNRYIRAHITYETPFLLLRHLNKYSRYVQNERFYLSGLVVPHLKPYIEFGYGIGTHIFDLGVFIGFKNWKYSQIGCKFTFELFNR